MTANPWTGTPLTGTPLTGTPLTAIPPPSTALTTRSRGSAPRSRRGGAEDGLALLAVLVALSVLLALSAPFVLSMRHGDEAARAEVDEIHAAWGSASARDAVLQAAARSPFAFSDHVRDWSPTVDTRTEFPSSLALPDALTEAASAGLGTTLLQGEVVDLSRRIALDGASPLVLANLLGTAVRLRQDLTLDDGEMIVDGSTEAFPETGLLLVEREVIRYGGRDGNRFFGLERGQLKEQGYYPADLIPDLKLVPDTLVLDFRCVLAVMLPHLLDGDVGTRRPLGAVREIQRIEELGFAGFSEAELDVLERHCTAMTLREQGATWGRPERVFEILPDPVLQVPRLLQVRSAAQLGAGRVVRIRSTDGRLVEYGLVVDTRSRGNIGTFNLPDKDYVALATMLTLPFQQVETVIEPLVPVPVNVNTAEEEVLTAILANLSPERPGRVRDEPGQINRPPFLSRSAAAGLATQLTLLRGDVDPARFAAIDPGALDAVEPGPFDGWEDFGRRVVPLLIGESQSLERRFLALRIYDVLQVGCPGRLDMGTLPIAFGSSPLVAYRGAAARLKASGLEVARHERSGIALALPGVELGWGAATQELFDDFARLDRQHPFWQTGPTNTSAIGASQLGTIPPLKTEAHLLARLFPDSGFGQPRFPDRSGDDASLRPQPATTPWAYPGNVMRHESFRTALHPEGRDLGAEGFYPIVNNGPRAGAAQAPIAGGGQMPAGPVDNSRIEFPLTDGGGLTARFATSFWFRLAGLGPQVLYDLANPADGSAPRNRIRVELVDGALRFEVIGDAGLDPDPSLSLAGAERPAGTWQVAIDQYDLQPNVWYHVSFSALGDRPGQLTFLIDGAQRGQPAMQTFLAGPIQPYQPVPRQVRDQIIPGPRVGCRTIWPDPVPNLADDARYLQIPVESTDGFPPQGVLRIGLELFEYTAIAGSAFICDFDDSMGGRLARAVVNEFVVGVPQDLQRDLQQELQQLRQEDVRAAAPGHPVGAAVELYGYSAPVYPQTIVQPGSGSLLGSIGAFSVARVVNDDPDADPILATQRTRVGVGIDANSNRDLVLGNPQSEDFPVPQPDPRILEGFPQQGGYCLLVQRGNGFQVPPPRNGGGLGAQGDIGGLEVIRYASRVGNRLVGIQRRIPLLGAIETDDPRARDLTQPRSFVTRYNPNITAGPAGDPANLLPLYYCYAIPISLPVAGAANRLYDPTEFVQWAQLRSGNRDVETEWVRYNRVLDANQLVRVDTGAFGCALAQVNFAPTQAVTPLDPGSGGGGILDMLPSLRQPFELPIVDGVQRIGYVDAIETDFPAIAAFRNALQFRGDPWTGTSSHPHPANTEVLPVHRFEFDRRGTGVSAGRAGRSDRVALVQGSRRLTGDTPEVEWHTVNWTVRRFSGDNIDPDTGRAQPGQELFGTWPFQLVAFQAPVTVGLVGEAVPSLDVDNLTDSRLLDRMVKYPSGELPAADVDQAQLGSAIAGDGVDSRALVDEVAVVSRMALPRMLDQELPQDATEFFVLPNVLPTPVGMLGGGVLPQQFRSFGVADQFPQNGGLLQIDGELLAYQTYDPGTGRVQVAAQGRGLLGTQARGHAEGAVVHFLEQVPTSILANGLSPSSHELTVQALDGMPRFGGTLLAGQELLHYAWTRGQDTFGMPTWSDPDRSGGARIGLLRGRYGTLPATLGSGAPLIWFPQRYWDRHRPRSDDPESAFAQFTLDHGPAFFGAFGWREELGDGTIDVEALVRIDDAAPWDADPEQTPGLLRFDEGQPDGRPNPILRHGRRFQVRFQHVYRPGAFDPGLFLLQGWKQAPTLRWFVLGYEGETRILSEQVTAR